VSSLTESSGSHEDVVAIHAHARASYCLVPRILHILRGQTDHLFDHPLIRNLAASCHSDVVRTGMRDRSSDLQPQSTED
jgi:hypothetical protein